MLTRQAILEHLTPALKEAEHIRAAWLGGSDATGRADDLSDLDICMVVRAGEVEAAAATFEAGVRELTPIRIAYRLPMPTWHGFHQAFYQLEGAPEHLMLDWLVVEQGEVNPWMEIERHGTPRVLFDKDGDVTPRHVDRVAIAAQVRNRVAELRLKFPMFRHMAAKLAKRGLPADAAYFYQGLVLRPVVDMLRAAHCPERFDFGFRYLRDDLPREAYEAVCRLTYPAGPEDFERFEREATALFDGAVRVWEERGVDRV